MQDANIIKAYLGYCNFLHEFNEKCIVEDSFRMDKICRIIINDPFYGNFCLITIFEESPSRYVLTSKMLKKVSSDSLILFSKERRMNNAESNIYAKELSFMKDSVPVFCNLATFPSKSPSYGMEMMNSLYVYPVYTNHCTPTNPQDAKYLSVDELRASDAGFRFVKYIISISDVEKEYLPNFLKRS